MDQTAIPVEACALGPALGARIDACRRLAAGADSSADVQVALVVGDLDLAAVVRALLAACTGASPAMLRQWLANLTKIIVLAGQPDKVAARFSTLPMVIEGKVGVVGPAPASALSGLRRLLRLLNAGAAAQHASYAAIDLDGAEGETVEVSVASAQRSLEEFLVALSHTVAEAHLLGHFARAAVLRIRPAPDLHDLSEQDVYVRVHRASIDSASLQIHARVRREYTALALPSLGDRP